MSYFVPLREAQQNNLAVSRKVRGCVVLRVPPLTPDSAVVESFISAYSLCKVMDFSSFCLHFVYVLSQDRAHVKVRGQLVNADSLLPPGGPRDEKICHLGWQEVPEPMASS